MASGQSNTVARLHPGLSQAEAERRLASAGPNELASVSGRDLLKIAFEVGREPMFLLILGAAALYLFIGDLGEGLFLFVGAMATIVLVIVQEARSEAALGALRELAQPRARVVRDGAEANIAARDLVPGDILLVGEGERAPADALLLAGDILSIDESTLTGESAPISKRLAKAGEAFPEEASPGPEMSPLVFAGTLIVRGQGVTQVARTGARSALGRIGASLAEIAHEPTPLQQAAGRLIGLLGAVALGFCAIVAIAYGILREDWVGGALAGITVAISLIPEEFPMVLAIFLALGAWRLAGQHVLARRSAVIEALGGATVLCVDKTGTLTENRMRVARLWSGSGHIQIENEAPTDGGAFELLRLARLASAVHPVDPMDRALNRLSPLPGGTPGGPERSWPLRPELMAVIQAWRISEHEHIAAAKGAPEAIFDLCRLPKAEVDHLHSVIAAFAEDGLRVLGVASARSDSPFRDDAPPLDFTFAGLVGFLDPLRADVPAALAETRAAGVKVVMITGDHPATALAVARASGFDVAEGVLTGSEITAIPFSTLCNRLKSVRVFARITPEQKLLLVEAFKACGEVVAMTGDGVNDAPALEAAHIGVAMGRRGTDVAREAADLVLLDDSFASIVAGVRLGRRIFTNLRNALTYITAIHLPIAGLALGPILFGLPPLLFPMHVVFLELAIDPTCALVFEAEPSEVNAMKKPPRRRDEPLFGPRQIVVAMAQGLGLLLGVLCLYAWALSSASEAQARGAAFAALVLGNLAVALAESATSWRLAAHRIYWLIALGVVSILIVILSAPNVSSMFGVAYPGEVLLTWAVLVALTAGAWAAVLKLAANSSEWRQVRAPPAM